MEPRPAGQVAEVAIFLARHRRQEILVLHRCPDLGSYWHAVSGTIEEGESVEAAAIRELREETGLDASDRLPRCPRTEFSYRLPQPSRAVGNDVRVCCFLLDVPDQFEPKLNWEHDTHWWVTPNQAPAELKWPSLRKALRVLLSNADRGAELGSRQASGRSRGSTDWSKG